MTCQSIAPLYSFEFQDGQVAIPPNRKKVLGYYPNDPAMDPERRIIGFNCNLGMGTSSSTLTITVSGHYGNSINVGRLAVFRCDEFGFGGMIKSITHTENQSGMQTEVVMQDLKEWLARYTLVLKNWHGSFNDERKSGGFRFRRNQGWNAQNVFRTMEGSSWGDDVFSNYGNTIDQKMFGVALPSVNGGDRGNAQCIDFGVGTTDYATRYGNISYYRIFKALVNYGVTIQGDWNDGNYCGMRVSMLRDIAGNECPYLTTSATSMSLLDAINNVMEEAGYDWTFHTPDARDWVNIKLVDKRFETTFGTIKNRIEDAKLNKKNLLNYSVGAEFKNEKTRRVVVGSPIEYVKEWYCPTRYQAGGRESNNYQHWAAMILGWDGESPIYAGGLTGGRVEGPFADQAGFSQYIKTKNLAEQLGTVGFPGFPYYWDTGEDEILSTATLATWKLFGILYPNSLSAKVMNWLGVNRDRASSMINRCFGQGTHVIAQACVEATKSLAKKSAQNFIYEEIAYPWMKQWVDTYYGKYYMAIVPKPTCIWDITDFQTRSGVFRGEGGNAVMMDEPIDAGWSDFATTLGLVNKGPFIDGSNKTMCYARAKIGDYQSRNMQGNTDWYFDPGKMNGDYYVQYPYVYFKMDIDGRAVRINNNEFGVVLKAPNVIPSTWIAPESAGNNSGLRQLRLMLGETNINPFSVRGGSTDYSYTNIFKESPAAHRFDAVALPFRNRVISYGAWYNQPRASLTEQGGVEFKVVDDLNPWTYGGVNPMSRAGIRLARDGIKKRTRYESGTITLAETPKRNMDAGGSSGMDPLMSSISVKFTAQGAITTYNYKTYTPKFGQSAETFNEFVKLGVSARRENYMALESRNRDIHRNLAVGMRAFGVIRDKVYSALNEPTSSSAKSLNNILIGSYPDQPETRGRRAEVGIDKKYGNDYYQDEDMYYQYGIISLDMLYIPVVPNTGGSHNIMGKMAVSYALSNWPKNKPFPAMPPYWSNGGNRLEGTGAILNYHINPFNNASLLNSLWDGRGMSFGPETEYQAYGNEASNTFTLDTQGSSKKDNDPNLRSLAMRGPLLLSSWGYDTNGKPIPNKQDTNNNGVFNNAPKEEFATNFMAKPHTWPCGPIDLRWDRERCVWVSPPSERLMLAKLDQHLPIGGIAKAKIVHGGVPSYYPPTYTDSMGKPITSSANNEIYIHDLIGRAITSGSRVIAYHWGVSADYVAVQVADEYLSSNAISSCCTMLSQDPTNPCYVDPDSEIDNELADIRNMQVPTIGFMPNGFRTLYDLATIFSAPDLYETPNNGQMHVLGFDRVNSIGWPCMTGIPIVNCSGEYSDGSGYFGPV